MHVRRRQMVGDERTRTRERGRIERATDGTGLIRRLPRRVRSSIVWLAIALGSVTPIARAGDDPTADAVESLLAPGAKGERAEPSDEALDRFLASTDADRWLLVEHLLARDRQDVAVRVATRVNETALGPIGAYVAATDAPRLATTRSTALRAALAARAKGDVDGTLKRLDEVRAASDRPSVFGVLAERLRSEVLAGANRAAESLEAELVAGEQALRVGWWDGAGPSFQKVREKAWIVQDWESMMRAAEGDRALDEASGFGGLLGAAEENLGEIAKHRGDFPAALRHFDEAIAFYENFAEGADIARARDLRSRILAELGEFRAALDEQRAIAPHFDGLPHEREWAEHQLRAGLVRYRIGDAEGAAKVFALARTAFAEMGDAGFEGIARGNLGLARKLAGRWEEAIEEYRAAESLLTKVGGPTEIATARVDRVLAVLARVEAELAAADRLTDSAARDAARAKARSPLADARSSVAEALSTATSSGAAGIACVAIQVEGRIRLLEGRAKDAVGPLEQARREAHRLRSFEPEVTATIYLARARLALEDWPGAMREARAAASALAEALGGLPESDLARARSSMPDVYDLGARAARRAGDPDELMYFLEAGRAAALLRALGGRAAALRATVPEALDAKRAAARAAKVDAFVKMQAEKSAELAVTRALRKAYEERRSEEQRVDDEITQVQAAAAARLVPARLLSIADVRARLKQTARPGIRQVFVSLNFQDTEGSALLVEDAGARVVNYAAEDVAKLRDAFESLAAARNGLLDAAALDVVKRRLVDPWKLPVGPTRLLVSPDRELAYVPLVAVLPDDWELAFEPSATTYDLLAERRVRRGRAICALGDPDYGTLADPAALAGRGVPRLVALPAARAEVMSIASSPGDQRLFGAQATERGLSNALASAGQGKPWKSVHLACHGLVDVEWPAYSCLALAAGDGEDGFLTSSEILRLPLQTDLAVLSACETGTGTFIRGEGLMSLARSFMFAGAPRVIASLWNVDDDATAFLMTTFYREWLAGRGTADALRRAQAAVRDHEVTTTVDEGGKPVTKSRKPWSAPKFWAAWVLWGLTD